MHSLISLRMPSLSSLKPHTRLASQDSSGAADHSIRARVVVEPRSEVHMEVMHRLSYPKTFGLVHPTQRV